MFASSGCCVNWKDEKGKKVKAILLGLHCKFVNCGAGLGLERE